MLVGRAVCRVNKARLAETVAAMVAELARSLVGTLGNLHKTPTGVFIKRGHMGVRAQQAQFVLSGAPVDSILLTQRTYNI